MGVERVRTAYMSLQWGMGELLGWGGLEGMEKVLQVARLE